MLGVATIIVFFGWLYLLGFMNSRKALVYVSEHLKNSIVVGLMGAVICIGFIMSTGGSASRNSWWFIPIEALMLALVTLWMLIAKSLEHHDPRL